MTPVEVVARFVSALNAHDVAAAVALMTDDHRLIDSLGAVVPGSGPAGEAWRGYLRMVPDYRIDVRERFHQADVVVLLGSAGGTFAPDGRLHPEDSWHTPAAWRAVVRGDRVAEWRVFADNEPIRQRMAARRR